ARALRTHRIDHIRSRAPSVDQVENDVGRVLQVGVERDHRVAACDLIAAGERGLMAEVPAERDGADAGIGLREVEDGDPAAIGAAVIHQDGLDLEPAFALDAVRDPHELLTQEWEALLLVEDRHDERDQLGHQRRPPGAQVRTFIGGAWLTSTWDPGQPASACGAGRIASRSPAPQNISGSLGSYTAIVGPSPGIRICFAWL